MLLSTHGLRHKVMGYIGVASVMVLFFSGVSMQLEILSEVQAELQGQLAHGMNSSSWALIVNIIIHTLSFLQVSEFSFYLVATSINAARRRQIQKHKITMSQLHLLLADMAVPRLTAFLFRYFFPWIDRNTAMSLACMLQWYRHTQLLYARAEYMVKMNLISFGVSAAIAVATWASRGQAAIHSNVAGALIMITLGLVIDLNIPVPVPMEISGDKEKLKGDVQSQVQSPPEGSGGSKKQVKLE